MACLHTFTTDHPSNLCPSMSPRISFSNDFVDTQQAIKHERSSSRSSPSELLATPSLDFEFSVATNCSLTTSADELFFKGRLLPFKDHNSSQINTTTTTTTTTLRDELLIDEDDVENDAVDLSARPPKGPSRWRELWRMKRTNNVIKRDHDNEIMENIEAETKSRQLVHVDVDLSEISEDIIKWFDLTGPNLQLKS
ncbi:hypothetical protein Syun_015345 [Stephania yunnanensis]|uniref:Uncharacterized protein n=1 Tax=Stephania yunnanensis TaxID=152371 RepID=A0AAP0PCU6_9MAGN